MTEPGDLLGANYRVREVLTGGMGQIYLCDWESDVGDAPEPIALKTFQRRFFFESAARLAFVREASTWLRLSHLPHILPVILIEHIDDQPYIVMPAVPPGPEGERSIADLLERGPLDPDTALGLAFQIALALDRAAGHIEGLVHGDLKPANVLLINGDAYLSDFGLVSAVSLGRADPRLQTTPAYRAPELTAGQPPSVAGDVYAFGVLLFEMLVGRPPPTDRADLPARGLPAAILAVATACLAEDPAERPSGFREVIDRITAIYERFDPPGLLMLIMRGRDVMEAMLIQARELRLLRIRGLRSLDPEQALEELNTVEPDDYDAPLWLELGVTLSLLEQAEDALEALEVGLAGDLSDRERTGGLIEYALVLKRLERFDDARRLLEELLRTISDDDLPQVIVNLATVHLDQGNGADAVQALEPFVRRRPDLPEAWGNLGEGYVMVGRHDDAVAAYGRALALAPQHGAIRVRLAAVYMDHLGRLPEAWSALDTAFDSGHFSRQWFVRMLACSLLLDRTDIVDGLIAEAESQMPQDVAEELIGEGIDIAKRLAERPRAAETRSEVTASMPMDDDPHAEAPARAGIPFLNFRFYDFFDFTVDYYQHPDAEDYVPVFLGELRRAMRDPRMDTPMRGSPLYFARCPACGVHVLTNRDVGKRITCRMCDAEWHTEPLSEPALDALVAELSVELGVERADDPGAPEVHVLFVKPPEAAPAGLVGEVCRELGMVALEPNRAMSLHMHREAVARGLVEVGEPYSVWTLTAPKPAAWVSGATAAALAVVLRALQDHAPGVQTLSTTMTVEQLAAMSDTVEDLEADAEQTLRERLRTGEAQAGDLRRLAQILTSRGDYDGAERFARASLAADEDSAEGWAILGTALLHQEDHAGARGALERSLARDPTSALVLLMLARCHHQLGDERRAAECLTRAESYGAGRFATRP